MIGIDTNLLLYARLAGNRWHERARDFLESLGSNPDVVIAELVLVELYVALRNPAIVDPPLEPAAAAAECAWFRNHPRWQLAEQVAVMERVWQHAGSPGFARRRIFDVRLGLTLQAHGVTDLATANVADFEGLGFRRVWNPLLEGSD